MQADEPHDVRIAYEAWHRTVQSDTAAADRPWHDLLFRHITEADLADRRVLEIGCGRGELACRIMAGPARPSRYVAADFAASAVQFGRERQTTNPHNPPIHGLHWLVADIQRIPLRDWFDTVISCETIEHLPDPLAALREIHRVLRPGGLLFLTTPNYMGPFGLYRGYLRLRGRRYTEGGQPISRLTSLPRTWGWLRQAGFRVRTVDAVGHYILRPGHVPYEPAGVRGVERWLWPFGLHSLFVAERPQP